MLFRSFMVSEYFAEQAPLVIKALYQRVVTKLTKFCALVVLAMFVHEVPLLVENSQRVTDPVCPVSEIVPELAPEHTVSTGVDKAPPTDNGLMVIVASVELAEGQTPLCTTALYFVVWVKFKYVCDVVVFVMGV